MSLTSVGLCPARRVAPPPRISRSHAATTEPKDKPATHQVLWVEVLDHCVTDWAARFIAGWSARTLRAARCRARCLWSGDSASSARRTARSRGLLRAVCGIRTAGLRRSDVPVARTEHESDVCDPSRVAL